MRRWLDIQREDLRAAVWAFATLGGLLAAHALMETARDALFLASLPATRLPWVYLAIAAVGLVVVNLGARGRMSAIQIASTQVIAGAITLAFWVVAASQQTWTYYAFYVWSGMFATVATVQFWVYVGDHYTVSEAKRTFGFVGTGGILGAIAGSAAARALAELVATRHLILAAAVVMIAAAPLPLILGRALRGKRVSSPESRRLDFLGALVTAATHGYARRLAALVFVSTVAFTLVDFVFKSVVDATIAAADLGAFFATFYVVLNVSSLVAQLALVPFVLKRVGLGVSLVILPVLLMGGAAGVALGTGLVAALLMKGADGSLRHSLHRTATEVLYLPMSSSLRAAVKLVIDVVAHRGGQAFASLMILAAVTWLGGTASHFAVAAAVVVAVWLLVAIEIRPRYLDLFRATLDDESVRTRIDFPELDMESLESLLTKLNSLNDDEVVAVMDVLALQGKTHLIPDLILFHPSRKVVLAAMRRFIRERRSSFLPIAERLLGSPDPEIRAAALLAHDAVAGRAALVRRGLDDPDPGVRTTARVAMVARGRLEPERAAADLEPELAEGGEAAQLAFVRALRWRPSPALIERMAELAGSASLAVRSEIARAGAELRERSLIAPLIGMLGERAIRDEARAALVALGDEALDALVRALDDPGTPLRVRQHIPRTISRFPAGRAVPPLLDRLADGERDEVTRFKCLRGLGRLLANNPDIALDRERVARLVEAELAAAARLLRWQVSADRGASERSLSSDPVHRLLVDLLADKQRHALERAFRLVGLLYPRENLEGIYHSLSSRDRRVEASGRELLTSLLDHKRLDPLLAMVEHAEPGERLASLEDRYPTEPLEYDELLVELAAADVTLQCAALRLAAAGGADRDSVIAAIDDPDEPRVAQVIAATEPRAAERSAEEG